ncbi:MAG: S8 family serine peptidase [Burkholderiaceae bacterium]|nr:S8 family serine peptidase [Burkholderiaceae bacterium]
MSTITGTLRVSETAAVDSDTNDSNQPGWRRNDTLATAQAVPNPALVVGYLAMPGEVPDGAVAIGDTIDVFEANLGAGQVVELEFAADPARIDLDLALVDDAGDIVGLSVGVNRYECVRVTTAGRYRIAAALYEAGSAGGSTYQLRLVSPGAAPSCPNATAADAGYLPGEIVVRERDADVGVGVGVDTARAKAITGGATGASSGGLALARNAGLALIRGSGQPGSNALLRIPTDATARLKSLARLATLSLATSKAATTAPAGFGASIRPELTTAARHLLDTVASAKQLARTPGIAFAVPNQRVQAMADIPLVGALPSDDPEYGRQRWHYEQISLPAAMDVLAQLPGTQPQRPVVAVIDTGIVADHPDLVGQIVAGYDFLDDPGTSGDGDGMDPDPDDASPESSAPVFHGTHVAGTVAASGFNAIGGLGVAPMARIMPLRVLAPTGGGSSFDVAEAIRFAAGLANVSGILPATRADVVNLSLGANAACADPIRQAVLDARASGVVVVASAGNTRGSYGTAPVSSPGNCPGAIAVGATDARRLVAYYSNGGPELAVSAPGGDMTVSTTGTGAPDGVRSTAAQFDLGVRVPTYTALQGTSMAAPHVAGVIAMMRWINPALTPGQIDVLLANGALTDDLGTPGRDNIHGWGLVNARKAVDAALASLTEPPSPLGRIEALPSALSLGATRAEAELELQRVGNTDETVTSIAWNSPAIEVIADQVDSATGLGRYRIRARREAIAEGTTVFPTIDIGTSSGRGFVVQVTVERRVASIGLGEVGAVYVIAVDANDPARATIAATLADPPVDGHYGYRLSVPAGRQVRVYAGTDLDNDTQICVAGEVCGAYPSMGDTIEAIDTSGDVHAIDFLLAPLGGASGVAGIDR